jgi:hypothetical protein
MGAVDMRVWRLRLERMVTGNALLELLNGGLAGGDAHCDISAERRDGLSSMAAERGRIGRRIWACWVGLRRQSELLSSTVVGLASR